MPINSSQVTGSGLSIGDLVATARTMMPDGRNLIPLAPYSRVLTAQEQSDYPQLLNLLDVGLGVTRTPRKELDGLPLSSVSPRLSKACNSDGTAAIVGEASANVLSVTDDGTTVATVIELTLDTGDVLEDAAMSADGTIRAVVAGASTGGGLVLWVSTNSGSSYTRVTESVKGSISGNMINCGSVEIAPDGSAIFVLLPGDPCRYIRIDDPASSLVLDVDLNIRPNLPYPSSRCCASWCFESPDNFIVTYLGEFDTNKYRVHYAITTDGGATFTDVRANMDLVEEAATTDSGNFPLYPLRAVMDNVDPTKLIVHSAHQFTGTVGLLSSGDSGATWVDNSVAFSEYAVPLSADNSVFINSIAPMANGSGALSVNQVGLVLFTVQDTGHIIWHGNALVSDKNNVVLHLGWDETYASAGIAGTIYAGSSANAALRGKLERGRLVPATPPNCQMKLIADAIV